MTFKFDLTSFEIPLVSISVPIGSLVFGSTVTSCSAATVPVVFSVLSAVVSAKYAVVSSKTLFASVPVV